MSLSYNIKKLPLPFPKDIVFSRATFDKENKQLYESEKNTFK